MLGSRRLRALGLRGSTRLHIAVERWPAEPVTPRAVRPESFQRALAQLCPPETRAQALVRITHAILTAANERDVDPFLLAALAHHQSGCSARSWDSWGVGLTRINRGMHHAQLAGGAYHYVEPLGNGAYRAAELALHRYPFSARALLAPEANLYFAAAFAHLFERQCPALDTLFVSAPHRHPVSHLIWGDEVRSALPEALILIGRRRILEYYRNQLGPTRARAGSVLLASPLDGAPRVVYGLVGDPRDNGRRAHGGIDIMAALGEPVRAIADGTVRFAGVELRDSGPTAVPMEKLARARRRRMGPRGVFVHIDHGLSLSSLYVHLASYSVRPGQSIKRGQRIGTVGLTGVHSSDAHLHLGLFWKEQVLDPMRYLAPYVLTNDAPRPTHAAAGRHLGRRRPRSYNKP